MEILAGLIGSIDVTQLAEGDGGDKSLFRCLCVINTSSDPPYLAGRAGIPGRQIYPLNLKVPACCFFLTLSCNQVEKTKCLCMKCIFHALEPTTSVHLVPRDKAD